MRTNRITPRFRPTHPATCGKDLPFIQPKIGADDDTKPSRVTIAAVAYGSSIRQMHLLILCVRLPGLRRSIIDLVHDPDDPLETKERGGLDQRATGALHNHLEDRLVVRIVKPLGPGLVGWGWLIVAHFLNLPPGPNLSNSHPHSIWGKTRSSIWTVLLNYT
jgi:hypothetical protein